MSRQVGSRVRPAWWRWRHVVVCLLTALLAVPGIERAKSAAAQVPPPIDPSMICSLSAGCLPPAPLLNVETLQGGLYAATPEQAKSLRKLEDEAIDTVIELHGLSESDTSAVQTWARDEALATLYVLLVEAIDTAADKRTEDQENAVAWLTAMAHRKAVLAAEAAGREYVKWAGIDQPDYDSLLKSNPNKTQLEEFLDDLPQTWGHPVGTGGGYCAYRSPAPNASEYTGYNHQTCFTPCTNPLGCNPPTPSFDQFVKWGESAASYEMLNTEEFARTAYKIEAAVGMSIAVAAAVSFGAIAAVAVGVTAGSATIATALSTAAVAWVPTVVSPWLGATTAAAAVAGVVLIVIAAIIIGVIQLIAVIDATKLPGQLAELIVDARTDPPEVDELVDTDEGATSLFALFVGATLPAPIQDTCDNSSQTRGIVVIAGMLKVIGAPPCLNPTGIPEPSWSDPQFLVKEQGATSGTLSPTITWKDSKAGTTTTARLHKNWFITTTNGTTEQTLEITYTDWDGRQQKAYLLGSPTNGYAFVSFQITDDTDLTTCLDDGTCSESESLQYQSPDGKKLAVTVQPWRAGTGAPSYDPTPPEGVPVSYDANGFAPANATGEITYRWRFENASCFKPCVVLPTMDGPSYGAPVLGATVTHTWAHSGMFKVELTATDSTGRSATTTVPVTVQNLPPDVRLGQDCPTDANGDPLVNPGCLPRTGGTVKALQLWGGFDDAGRFDLTASINWGDGSDVVSDCIPVDTAPRHPLQGPCQDTSGNGLELQRGAIDFSFGASHSYAESGTYFGTVWVSDGVTATSEKFTMTIRETPHVLVTTDTAAGGVRVSEHGATSDTVDVRLAEAPTEDVTVTFDTAIPHQVDVPDPVTFTPDNWDQPRTVTIRAIDDEVDESDPHPASVAVSVDDGASEAHVSIDGTRHSMSANIPVQVGDNDGAGLSVSPSSFELTEGGASTTLTVGLATDPQDGGVEIGATASDGCTVTPSRLFLKRPGEQESLTVTPPAPDHRIRDTTCTVSLVGGFSPEYEGIRTDVVGSVSNVDVPGVTITPTDLFIPQFQNSSATYSVVLDTIPDEDVTITPTLSDDAVTVSGPMTFTSDNWNQPRTVTVATTKGSSTHTAVISHNVTTADDVYSRTSAADVRLTVGWPGTSVNLVAEPNPAGPAEPITVTATVQADGVPTGSIRFIVDGVPFDPRVALVDREASLDLGVLALGSHTIKAFYSPSSGHQTSSEEINVVVTNKPEPGDDTLTVTEDAAATTVEVLANDRDADGDTLTVDDHTQPANGDVTCDDTSCTYTPDPNFHGTDTFTYTVSDGVATATATVTITIESVNDTPVAGDDTVAITEDAPATTIEVIGNDSDADDDTLTIDGHTQADHGEVTCDQTSCTYTPDRDFHGTDRFTYTVTDGTTTATATVTVTVESVNDAPVAGDDTVAITEDAAATTIEVIGTDSDADDDTLTIDDHTQPDHGEVICDGTSCAYTPDHDFHGTDTFTYAVSDGTVTATGTVTITVDSVNDAPVAVDDAYTTAQDTTLDVAAPDGVLANDSDVEGDPLARVREVTGPAHGSVTLRDDGSFTYTPAQEYSGADSFTYRVSDDHGARSETATVSLTVSTATVTTLTATPNQSRAGQPVTFTAMVTAAGDAVTDGTVTFLAGTTTVAADVPVDDHGRAMSTTATLTDGTHSITASYHPAAGWASSTSIPITLVRDSKAPTITIARPAARRFWQGAGVTADYTCTDQLSGVAACTGTVADGDPIPTSTTGVHRFTVTARDHAGNQFTTTVTYTINPRPTCRGQQATIIGTPGIDVLRGSTGADVIVGRGGNDRIVARGGNDIICARAGHDTIDAGRGNDTITGGPDSDTCNGGPGTDRAATCEQRIAIP